MMLVEDGSEADDRTGNCSRSGGKGEVFEFGTQKYDRGVQVLKYTCWTSPDVDNQATDQSCRNQRDRRTQGMR